ncbi:MAG: TIGR04086 family membrane protein [Clostridia bacterium]|nr:TIGR04086 family membrane protein [Clostridia bacterium]
MNFISNFNVKKYIVSFLLAFLITLLILSVSSIIFSFFPPSKWVLNLFSDYAYLLSGFIASFLCARASSRRGFITGALASFFYIGILVLLGFLIFNSNIFTLRLTKVFGLSVLCGGIGGILGINSK